MSKLYDLRRALADAIIAADMGFTADNTIILRRGDLWNSLATAIGSSAAGLALHIGIAEGAAQGDDNSIIELTIPLTILTLPVIDESAQPEEDVWEALVTFVCGLKLDPWDHVFHEFRFRSFSDIEIPSPDGGTPMTGRQTVFARTITLT